jgi:hypothetical protein
MKGEKMETLKIAGLIAAIALLLFAFFKLVQFFCAEWKRIEADEAERRRCPYLRNRGGI